MISKYFGLQLHLMNQRFKDLGFQPIIGCLILIGLFGVLSIFLFNRTEFAPYIFIIIALIFSSQLSQIKRREFLQTIFPKRKFITVRILENLILSIPFLLFLIYQQLFLETALLLIFQILFSLTNLKSKHNITIPTLYSKYPFEFLIGFRSTFFLYPLVYLLAFVAYSVDNFNLGIFSMMLIFLIYMTYYHSPEDEFFVWSYNISPQKFLFHKIKVAVIYASILLFPMVIGLGILFFNNIQYIFLFILIGYGFLICMILAKYSVYPQIMGLVQYLLISFCFYFPPLLLLLIPLFLGQSLKRIKHLLS